jgi:hypothetical protein
VRAHVDALNGLTGVSLHVDSGKLCVRVRAHAAALAGIRSAARLRVCVTAREREDCRRRYHFLAKHTRELRERVRPRASSRDMPSSAACCPALPCPALPCPALPCPALPCPALRGRAPTARRGT